jgi:16S rRNA (cytidine1402-2'-O)-methyltransferase
VPLAVCATPIGNLDDVTLRVLAELRDADVVLAEDTRRTRVLLERHGIRAHLLSYHEHNEAERIAQLVPRLEQGERMALVTDAGMPALSDPGARLIGAARAAGLAVTVLPGPSAVETAVAASGFDIDRFTFVGFLPRREAERTELWRASAGWGTALVAFESPSRLPASLRSLAAFAPERELAVCRELTKVHEEIVRGPASEVAKRFDAPPKGEITLVVGAGAPPGPDPVAARTAVSELVAAGARRRTAAEVVARLTGASRNELYRSTLDER